MGDTLLLETANPRAARHQLALFSACRVSSANRSAAQQKFVVRLSHVHRADAFYARRSAEFRARGAELGNKGARVVLFFDRRQVALGLGASPRIQQTGFLDSPLGILNQSRALAILSRYGYGFKTKILDAIQNQCYVLMPPELYARQPKALQPYCIRVDLDNPHSFPAALELCLRPFPTGAPNQELKQTAYHALDQVLACRT